MKSIRFILTLFALFSGSTLASGQTKPTLEFEKIKHDFGTISKKKVEKITIDFDFINSDSIPVVIFKADVACSCLSVDYPKHPIKSSQKGTIRVVLDTKTQHGIFNRNIFIKSNAKEDVLLLRISGIIKD